MKRWRIIYELPPDASKSCPQNISVTVEGQVSYNWAEPVESSDNKAELMNKRPLSDTSLECFTTLPTRSEVGRRRGRIWREPGLRQLCMKR